MVIPVILYSAVYCHRGYILPFYNFMVKSYYRLFHSSLKMKKVVFVLGAPGSGKGTQCEKIVHNFGYVHLSAGSLLRKETAKGNSKHRETLEHCFRNVKVVPSEITCSLLGDAMEKSNSENFLIDAFPVNEDNLNFWTSRMSMKFSLQFVLYLECPQEVCIERCLKRGSAGSRRSDDNLEALKKRFVTYVNDSMPIVQYYKDLNLLRQVSANKGSDEVFEEIKNIFEKETLGSHN